ncbi:hypothetical protein DPEC_G00169470 [Dallia pectoralis]|uniref:Uncharacterized protein n=1 Tax=Dallia pectoralis TaxID=75939 RepID=A0ACC2GDA4_DALPE|nr:hypothetical protein DPEC_G00169470 [Dallia pectoralis]
MDLAEYPGSESKPENLTFSTASETEPNVTVKEEEEEEEEEDGQLAVPEHLSGPIVTDVSKYNMIIKKEEEDDEEEEEEDEEDNDIADLEERRKSDPDYRPDGAEMYQLHHLKKKIPVKKLHPCPECGKVFDRPSHLERHEKTHTRIKKLAPDYPCAGRASLSRGTVTATSGHMRKGAQRRGRTFVQTVE